MRIFVTCLLFLAIGTAGFAADTGNRAPAKPHREVQPNVPIGRPAGDTIASAILISSLPFRDVGTTSGFSNDYDATCPYGGSTAPDVVYAIVPDTTIYVDIDLCGSAYDTKLYVYDTDLNIVACNDDYYYDSVCNFYVSRLAQVAMAAGNDFFIVVDGHGAEHGSYHLSVTIHEPCILDYPMGADLEYEPPLVDEYVDSFNGGCTHPDHQFTQLNGSWDLCGGDFCGRSGWYHSGGEAARDTDWFIATIPQNGILKLVLDAEQETDLYYIESQDCDQVYVEMYATAGPCRPDSLIFNGSPDSEIWVIVAPSTFSQQGPDREYDYTLYFSGLWARYLPWAATDDDAFGCRRLAPEHWFIATRLLNGFENDYDLADSGYDVATPGPDGVVEFYLNAGEETLIWVNPPIYNAAKAEPRPDYKNYFAITDDLRLLPGGFLEIYPYIEYSEYQWYYFTPPETGYYYLLMDQVDSEMYEYKAVLYLDGEDAPQPPPNVTCDGASAVPQGPFYIEDDLSEAANTADPGREGCGGGGDTGRNVFYRVDFQAGHQLDAVMRGQGAWDEELYLIRDCEDPQHTCVAGCTAYLDGVRLTYGSLIDETLWLVCDSYGAGPRPFYLVGQLSDVTSAVDQDHQATTAMSVRPNPFNPRTEIHFTLSVAQSVTIAVFDLCGHRLVVLTDDEYEAGPHSVSWEGRDFSGRELPSGTYFCQLKSAEGVLTRKVVLLR